MIQRDYVKAWSVEYPWRYSEMVEQDLIICRAIVSIFSDPFLAKELAWKGGTALHKLYLYPEHGGQTAGSRLSFGHGDIPSSRHGV